MLMISWLQFVTTVIKPDRTVVGHIPKLASKAVLFFLRKAGSVGFCEVTGRSVNCGVGLGLEILCNYIQVLRASGLHIQAPNSLIIAVQTTFYTDHY